MTKFPKWLDVERLIHGFKAMIACLLGILLTQFIGKPADQWVVVTIIVVMCAQIYVGSVLQKSYFRFLGTVLGCLFAIVALLVFGVSFVSILLTVCVSSLFFSYLATASDNTIQLGTLGAVTTAIIMLGHTPTVDFAIQRFLEITAGLVIAALVSQFFLPIHARTHLRRVQAKTLSLLRDYYVSYFISPELATETLDETIVKTLTKQRQLAKEAGPEVLIKSYDRVLFTQSLQCEKEILRSIDFMQNAATNLSREGIHIKNVNSLQRFNQTIVQSLNALIAIFVESSSIEEHIHLPDLTDLKFEIKANARLTHSIYLDGFLFSAQHLINSIEKLARLHHVLIYDYSKLAK